MQHTARIKLVAPMPEEDQPSITSTRGRKDDTLPQPRRPARPITTNERALESFAHRIALTGVAVRQGERLIFEGWDRIKLQAVRVIVEPSES